MHIVPCAVCDEPVIIGIEVWQSMPCPAALCEECDALIHWPLLRVIHLLRSKIYELELKLQQLG